MKNQIKIGFLSAALAVLALPVVAQNTDASAQGSATASTPAASASANGQVNGQTNNQRKENQQDRINNGVQSGQLTAGETSNLENKESKINQEERDMRKLDN